MSTARAAANGTTATIAVVVTVTGVSGTVLTDAATVTATTRERDIVRGALPCLAQGPFCLLVMTGYLAGCPLAQLGATSRPEPMVKASGRHSV